MGDDIEEEISSKQRDRIVASLDRMVSSGRITQLEADRLRAVAQRDEFDAAVHGVRVRHASAKLAAAIEDGSLGAAEADAILDRLRRGEHSSAIRAHLRSLLPRSRARRAEASQSTASGDAEADEAAPSAIDPVCKMIVSPTSSSAIRSYRGDDYFFCSTGCAQSFDADPERFASVK
jgi:YHS domain-containing protein